MIPYPVHFTVEKPARYTRLQLAIRLIGFVTLGLIGVSLGLVFVVAYVALPAFAAARLSAGRDPEQYLERDGARIVRALRWLAAISAWFGLVTERLPLRAPEEVVRVEVEPMGRPTPRSALVRLLLGIPSAIVLAVLVMIAWFVWIVAAIQVLALERVSDGVFAYLAGIQRWIVRLLAYQASLVDVYPPFSFEEAPPPPVPAT